VVLPRGILWITKVGTGILMRIGKRNQRLTDIVELLQEHGQIKNAPVLSQISYFTTLQRVQQRMLEKHLSGAAGQDFRMSQSLPINQTLIDSYLLY
jgi:hypothetical protein